MDTATQQQPSASLPLGAEESQGSNRTYVGLRTGKICQTDNKTQFPGWRPAQTKNKDNTVNNFFAKEYDHITGYVENVMWHTHKLPDGTVLTGWNVVINTADKTFVLQVGSNDRPFERFMNVMLGVDFSRPVKFVAFMGKNQKDQPQKVLLLSQGNDPETGKPVWCQPVLPEKWLSRSVINKCKQGLPLTDQEEKQVSRMADGTVNWNFPYIVQGVDEKWSMDTWRNHLMENFHEHVIPNVKAAAANQPKFDREPDLTHSGPAVANDIPLESTPGEPPMPPTGPASDDDIPF